MKQNWESEPGDCVVCGRAARELSRKYYRIRNSRSDIPHVVHDECVPADADQWSVAQWQAWGQGRNL